MFVFASVNSLAVPSKQITRLRPLSIAFRRRSYLDWVDCGVRGVVVLASPEAVGVELAPESALVSRNVGRAAAALMLGTEKRGLEGED